MVVQRVIAPLVVCADLTKEGGVLSFSLLLASFSRLPSVSPFFRLARPDLPRSFQRCAAAVLLARNYALLLLIEAEQGSVSRGMLPISDPTRRGSSPHLLRTISQCSTRACSLSPPLNSAADCALALACLSRALLLRNMSNGERSQTPNENSLSKERREEGHSTRYS